MAILQPLQTATYTIAIARGNYCHINKRSVIIWRHICVYRPNSKCNGKTRNLPCVDGKQAIVELKNVHGDCENWRKNLANYCN